MPFGSSARFTARMSASSTAGGVALELPHLQPADAVLGAEAAAELGTQIVQAALHLPGARRGSRAGSAPGSVTDRLKCRLPSPTCP